MHTLIQGCSGLRLLLRLNGDLLMTCALILVGLAAGAWAVQLLTAF